MARVQQWSGCLNSNGKSLDVSVGKIAQALGVIMGNLSGMSAMIVNAPDTIGVVCMGGESENRFMKVDMSEDGTHMLGVSLYGSTVRRMRGCSPLMSYTEYSAELHAKMMVAHVDTDDVAKIERLKQFFNDKFANIMDAGITLKTPTSSGCMKLAKGPPVQGASKEYVVNMSEEVPSDSVEDVDKINLEVEKDEPDS